MNTYYGDEASLGEAGIEYLLSLLGNTEFWLGVTLTILVIAITCWVHNRKVEKLRKGVPNGR